MRFIRLVIGFILFLVVFSHDSASSNPPLPEWAKRAVWYQIFPERFRNADQSNDPQLTDILGSWPHERPKSWSVSPWTQDWYRLQPWELEDTAGNKGFYYQVQRRRYGGDIQGIIDRLDYLTDLGITAIYLNPIFESPSLHKYDATMYHHVDNNFGPDPAGDRTIWNSEDPSDPSTWQWTAADRLFLQLIAEVHRRSIKIVIDGVFNHVGMTFWAFEDVKKNQQNSRYKDWFIIKQWDDPSTTENEFDYGGWYGVRELPELREDSTGIVSGPREHIHAVVKRWMDPNGDGDPSDGIDGWRLDVADMVGLPFWRQFRTWVREINPEAYLTGEVWWQDWQNDKMYNAAPWLAGDVFDAVMNYRWAREVCHYFVDRERKTLASEFDRHLAALRNDYRSEVNYVLMNLMDSHDTDRLLSRIINPDLPYDHRVGLSDNRNYDARKPRQDEIDIQKLIALFQMTYLGAPMIYYGDEVGMWGGDDPDSRKPMLWADLQYEDEASHPFGTPRPRDTNVADSELYRYYQKLIRVRRENPALMLGDYQALLTDDAQDLYSFVRTQGNNQIVVVINNSGETRDAVIELPEAIRSTTLVSLLDETRVRESSRTIHIPMGPKSGKVFRVSEDGK